MDFDPRSDAEAAEDRWVDRMATGAKLRIAGEIASLVATQLLEIGRSERKITEDLPNVTLDTRQLLDIIDSPNPLEASKVLGESEEAAYKAARFEEGVARAAKDTAEFIYERLENDAAHAPFLSAP